MKLLFVADGRSPIALNWIQYFIEMGYEVHLASTFPCARPADLASLNVIPVAFSGAEAEDNFSQPIAAGSRAGLLRRLVPVRARTAMRQWLGPLTLPKAAEDLRNIIAEIQPDLVHAMRIPYEGMLAALALEGQERPRLLVSIWGNDFTLHAPATPWLSSLTRRTLRAACGLHTDCQRDLRLAAAWGFDLERPAVVLPGGGGVQADIFYPPGMDILQKSGSRGRTIINPRGVRAYVRSDTFFRAIPFVLIRQPGVRFLCPAMAGERLAERWQAELGGLECLELLPRQSRAQLADLFRRSQVAVSVTEHDGTPNTLLEALACGCFPIAGDIESLREWITPGVNGLLVDPANPKELAEAILLALERPDLLESARQYNLRLIAERAEYRSVMQKAEDFYCDLINQKRASQAS